ncbi:MAG: hypothetical protein JWM76_2429 [Pseudonocardiales bacterium]|nr:hypothetical protein [Pseudonocardiales bacterium]
MTFLSPKARRSAPQSFLGKRLARQTPHPASFDCGIRVVSGSLAGEGSRWRYRVSGADPLIVGGVVKLKHGTKVTLRLLIDKESLDDGGAGVTKPGYTVLTALELAVGAQVQISIPPGELERFGLEAL